MKLASLLPDSGDSTALYRGHPWAALGATIYDGKKGFFLHQAVMQHDAILMQRPYTAQNLSIARTVKRAGKKLILDWDDLLSSLPAWNPNAHHFKGALPNLQELAALSDAVSVSTPALAEAARSWGAKNVHVIPNALDDSLKSLPKYSERKPICVWRGGNSHAGDLECGRENFKQLNIMHKIVFFGDAPSWAYELRDYDSVPVSDYIHYITTLNELAPEYLFFPLVDCQFNRCKSDIAAQEAWLTGCKLLHNGVGEYKGLPADSRASMAV